MAWSALLIFVDLPFAISGVFSCHQDAQMNLPDSPYRFRDNYVRTNME